MKDSPISYTKTTETRLGKLPPAIKIAFLDVGQGDTIVVSSPDTGEAVVVDCIDADAVLEYLKQEKITYLRGIIVTHLHEDHYGHVDDLLYRYHLVPGMRECEKLAFGKIIDRKNLGKLMQDEDGHQEQGISLSTVGKRTRKITLANIRAWCLEDKKRYIDPSVQVEAVSLPFKGTLAKDMYLIHPYAIDLFSLEPKGLNNTSVVLHIIGSGSRALLTGDLEPTGWQMLQANHPDLRSDVLKFPHHGGAWNASNTKTLLDAVQPSVVVISVGTEGEKYKHPNEEVFHTLSSPPYSHIRVLCTQATNQCRAFALGQKASVIHHLDQQANTKGCERIGSKHGCPCAGTIIIELGDKVRVIQPSQAFHQDSIIVPHFHSHKCVLTPISTQI